MNKGSVTGWKLDERVRSNALKEISPSLEERELVIVASDELFASAEKVISQLGLKDVEPMMAGSVAKGTMSKDPDIDLFILFPCDIPEEEMEKYGMEIGNRILDDPRKKYTQHPYLTGSFKGFNCDVVPCYLISKGSKVKTAVDRTPHHTEYINSRLKPWQSEEVLLLKSFLKSIGAYGAEDTVNGLSGYLVELLILRFSTFEGVIEQMSMIDPDVEVPLKSEMVFDTERDIGPELMIVFRSQDLMDQQPLEDAEYERMFKGDTLIFVDPVDPRRNVGAPVSKQTLNLIAGSAKRLIRDGSPDLFLPNGKRPFLLERIESEISEDLNLFSVELPDGDPGIVITQLRRSLRKLQGELLRKGFQKVWIQHLIQFPRGVNIDQSYLRARYVWEGEIPTQRSIFSLRTSPSELDPHFKHWGPPMDNKRMKDFREKHGDIVQIDLGSNRGFVILDREVVDPEELVISIWDTINHGSRFGGTKLRTIKNGELSGNMISALSGV